MLCNSVKPDFGAGVRNKYQSAFKGIPERILNINVKDYNDALKYWEMLKQAKYSDVHSDGFFHDYRYIRENNYSFLDKLDSYFDKLAFIREFCNYTKFPNLKSISTKINETFNNCLAKISRSLNNTTLYGTPYDVIDSGYDPTCSLGLEKSFPGSDLDKGYIILEGNHNSKSDTQIINEFKGELWNNLDQRIVSLNHPDTFPSVYTKNQVKNKLAELEPIANNLVSRTGTGTIIAAAGAVLGDLILGPFGVPLGLLLTSSFLNDSKKYEKIKNSNEIYPYTAAEFNRDIAQRIDDSDKREEAKNFAFFIETVEANLPKNTWKKSDSMFDEIKNSSFVRNSNVTQIGAWKRKIDGGYMKSKLRNREQLMRDFNLMTTEQQYELIKDVIKYSSDDQSRKFAKYFENDDDIKGRYDSLLRALK